MICLALFRFDPKFGPNVLYITPKDKCELPIEQISSCMDLDYNSFFIYCFQHITSANLIFEIENEKARGFKDNLMVSFISNEINFDANITNDLLEGFRNGFLKIKHLHRAFSTTHKDEEKLKEIYQYCDNYYQMVHPTLYFIEERNNKIFELSRFPSENPNPVMRLSYDYKVTYYNEASKDFIKKWKNTESNEPIFEIPDEYKPYIRRVIKYKKPLQFELKHKKQYYSFTIAPIKGQQYVNLYGHDITDLKLTNEKFTRIFNKIKKPIIILDENKNIININRAFNKFIGIPKSKLLGQSSGDLYNILKQKIKIQGKTEFQIVERKIKDNNGETIGLFETLYRK